MATSKSDASKTDGSKSRGNAGSRGSRGQANSGSTPAPGSRKPKAGGEASTPVEGRKAANPGKR